MIHTVTWKTERYYSEKVSESEFVSSFIPPPVLALLIAAFILPSLCIGALFYFIILFSFNLVYFISFYPPVWLLFCLWCIIDQATRKKTKQIQHLEQSTHTRTHTHTQRKSYQTICANMHLFLYAAIRSRHLEQKELLEPEVLLSKW